jgi:hypothetical protein
MLILFVLAIAVESCVSSTTNKPVPLNVNQLTQQTLPFANRIIPSATPQPTPSVLPDTHIMRHPELADFIENNLELTFIPKFDVNLRMDFKSICVPEI